MATITYHYPGGIYPHQYNPPIAGMDYNASFGELVDLSTATRLSTNSTAVLYGLDNGLKLKIIGTGLAFNASGDAIAGTISSIEVLLSNGTTSVMTIKDLNLSFETFHDAAAAAFDKWGFEEWLFNKSDTFNGSAGDDDLAGRAGNDILNGNDGDDHITGGEGDDTYDGGNGFDVLSYQDTYGTGTAIGGVKINATTGVATDPYGFSESFKNFEEYRGTQFADSFIGSAVDEAFMGLGGRDAIDGGAGVDTVRYDRDAQRGGNLGVSVNLTTGTAIDGFGSQDTLKNIENVRGTDANDAMTGSAVSNVLRGFAGNDALNGAGGADRMWGGHGNDIYVVDNTGDVVDESTDNGAGTDTVRSSISFNLGNTTAVKGSFENLTLLGTANINGAGNALGNILNGNSGNNSLNGGAGNDVINGGLGNDTLTGSTGLDTFFFNTALNATSNVDTINGFTVADDTIRLENAIFAAITGTGTLTTDQFAKNNTGLAADTSDRIIYETDTGKLFYDSNGSAAGGSIQFATIDANIAVTSSDFFMV
ncbi:calcium-binding protein [Ensifer sp. OTU672]|uniref:calcium-binding protein n=1 Tax=Ensifer sp. OTU672 TaxID=3043861 RepID=UPI00313E7BE9